MRRRLVWMVVLGLAGSLARAATPLYVSADVPTTETATFTTLLESQMIRYTVPPSYLLSFVVPGSPTLDGIHRMDGLGDWLFSVESANPLGGVLGGTDADPRDVIQYDGATGTYSYFFCGAAVGIPADVNVDALYLDGGDLGDLILSFDVPTTLGPFTFDPADLVRYDRTGVGCGGWTLLAANPDFDASAAGSGIPTTSNVIGASRQGLLILSFDVPTDLGPPGVVTYLPGQIVSWNGLAYALYEPLVGWPISSQVDGLSAEANPGVVPSVGPPALRVNKAVAPPTDLILDWSASCSQGAVDYGIYEGTIGIWYSHTMLDCNDAGSDLIEQVTPGAGSTYYLVVPDTDVVEGSYGLSRDNTPVVTFAERPVGAVRCESPQVLTPCPP